MTGPPLKLELHFAYEIIASEAKFDNVRNYIYTLNEFPKFQGRQKVSSIYTDASKEKFGIYIVRFEKGSWEEFTISGIFNATDKQLDINIKEYFALLIGILIASYLDSLRMIHLHYILYCDNEISRLLASTKKAHIKFKNLARMTQILSLVQFIKKQFLFSKNYN